MSTTPGTDVEILIRRRQADDLLGGIRADLLRDPRQISSRFFYDDTGSALFEQICDLPVYYQTRTELSILQAAAAEIMTVTGAHELVELGAGAATKTRVLLDAMRRAGQLDMFVPFDVSEGILRRVAAEVVQEYPGTRVIGVVGDFMAHLDGIPDGGRRLVIFLGGTIGNLEPAQAGRFLKHAGEQMNPGDWFLLGTDLIKDRRRLHAAYNDPQGVTAAFNRNVLDVVNRLAVGDFDVDAFEHDALYNEDRHRIEMWLRPTAPQRVTLSAIDLTFDLGEGEGIRTEISTKYDRPRVDALLEAGGFEPVRWFTDPESLFALSLARLR